MLKNILFFFIANIIAVNDLTLVGDIKFSDGLARQPIWIIDNLSNDLQINWLKKSGIFHKNDLPDKVKQVVLNTDQSFGNIIFYTDHLWFYRTKIDKSDKIKIASSMFDADLIPNKWVKILNNDFDAVVVPDKYHIKTYLNSGVKIPIFVLPLGLYLDDFLNNNAKSFANKPFVFGNSCSLPYRKNHIRLIEAFAQAFGDNPDVKLIINSRACEPGALKKLKDKITELNLKNIHFSLKSLSSSDYISFLKSIDCYVSSSAGEGFAITPREALALGCPVILTNNTAHKTICESGFVRSVNSEIPIKAYYEGFPKIKGNFFDCKISDLKDALIDVYNNYDYHLNLANYGREWVKNYTISNLKSKYLTLFKPKKIIFGKINEINDDCLITNSLELYDKYKKFM